MAVIDDTRGVLVVRIVYDGPALSGKTTSLQALARGVGRRVATPAEASGRTLFFDWVDYVGGLFDGRQIRCQIVSVPGQRELSQRRKLLLESADAIVMVLDTRREEWEFGLSWLKETLPHCRAQEPPVGLVLQANKRDAPSAVPAEELRETLARVAPIAVIPSAATSGDGIREAFVLSVRLALDRVRALAAEGRLARGTPAEDNPDELYARMRSAGETNSTPVNGALVEAVAASLRAELEPWPDAHRPPSSPAPEPDAASTSERAFVPDPMMPGGMIWPPVDGRALLHEVAALGIRPTRTGRADWAGSGSGFRFHSHGSAIFPDPTSARNELIEWARIHAANSAHLSTGRAVILADAGSGRLRLWQIVRAEATLRERLAVALPLADPNQVADELVGVATQLAAAREFFAETTIPLPCTLWTVGANSSYRPTFVGLMPRRATHAVEEPTGRDLLGRELSPLLRELRRARVDYAEVVARVASIAESSGRETPAYWLANVVLAA